MIWVLLFLAGALASFTLTVRSSIQQATVSEAAAQARALAEGGITLALHDMSNALSSVSWSARFPVQGQSRACGLALGTVVISIVDEAGKIDLNAAGEPLLRRLLSGLGTDAADAARLAAAILDYRDADSTRSPGGAELEEYRQAGRSTGPKNAPFDSTFELAQVLGFSSELAAKVRPFVTVHSGQRGIDPAKSSPELLELIGGGRAPTAGEPSSLHQPHSLLPTEWVSVSTQRAFALRAQATAQRGATHAIEAIVRKTASRSQPLAIASWHQVDARDLAGAIEIGPC